MKWNEHEQARPNVAGLASPVQQAEMKLILAGRWPPLKPLPVFKYETDAYRASIEFDKLRGEWVCHKTSLESNKVQELRGGLIEMTMALPHGPVDVIAECAAPEPQEKELEKDASRRLQAILEWRENYENGALYSGLQDYLSESQRDEINDSIRLTLTARQLQCNPKNVAYVFDALSKAGGKPAALLEIAQRNKRQGAVVPAKSEAAAPDGPMPTPVESLFPATLESFAEESIGSVFPEQDQPPSPELTSQTAPQTSKIVTPEILDASPISLADDLLEKVHHRASVAGLGAQVGRHKSEPAVDHIENSRSRKYVLEISGFHVAAVVILFAMISLTVGLTVGRSPLGMRSRDIEKSMPAVDATSPAPLNVPGATSSLASTPPAANTLHAPAVNPPAPEMEKSRSENPSAKPEPSPERNGSTGLIARDSPPPVSPKPVHSPKAVAPTNGAPRNFAPRGITPSAVLVSSTGRAGTH